MDKFNHILGSYSSISLLSLFYMRLGFNWIVCSVSIRKYFSNHINAVSYI